MPIIQTVKAPEQWLVEVNGGYDVCFAEFTLLAAAADGEVIANGATLKAIVSKGGAIGDKVRVMVRGNPSIVSQSQLSGTVDAAVIAQLAAQGIIVK